MGAQMPETRRPFVPNETNTRLLRDAFGRFATGVTIVTTSTQDGVAAITANSFSSVSLTPPLVLWSPDKNSRRFGYFEQAKFFAIHVLSTEQDDLCWDVARDVFALNDRDLERNSDGVPVIENCLARFECSTQALYEGGDHMIMVGQVNQAEMREEGDPLGFFKGQVGRFVTQ
jgi:flavin reductase (DIM6/NTAB) family NADH-FMN oxidoreductase RutF